MKHSSIRLVVQSTLFLCSLFVSSAGLSSELTKEVLSKFEPGKEYNVFTVNNDEKLECLHGILKFSANHETADYDAIFEFDRTLQTSEAKVRIESDEKTAKIIFKYLEFRFSSATDNGKGLEGVLLEGEDKDEDAKRITIVDSELADDVIEKHGVSDSLAVYGIASISFGDDI